MSARVVALLKYALLLTPIAVLPVVGCNSGGGGGGGNALTGKLIGCGLLTSGRYPQASAATTAYETCIVQCMSAGTCDELEGLVCGNFSEETLALLEGCYTQCDEMHGHQCDGLTLPPDSVCDGFENCQDGSDEVGCPGPFVCADGSDELPPDWKCDGEPDCQDGSDEVGCPGFVCGSGEQIPASWDCDGEPDCQDGSDEMGCAMPLCSGNGTETLGMSSFTTVSTLDTGPDVTTGFDTGPFDTGDTSGDTGGTTGP